jgi:hypothetical protein
MIRREAGKHPALLACTRLSSTFLTCGCLHDTARNTSIRQPLLNVAPLRCKALKCCTFTGLRHHAAHPTSSRHLSKANVRTKSYKGHAAPFHSAIRVSVSAVHARTVWWSEIGSKAFDQSPVPLSLDRKSTKRHAFRVNKRIQSTTDWQSNKLSG